MKTIYKNYSIWMLFWFVLVVVALCVKPYIPIDETRYVGVAWEMWSTGDFLVPHKNGALYGHKPPLLFWLFNLGWWIFGVNDWWPKLVPSLFSLGSLYLTAKIAYLFWPQQKKFFSLVPIILLSCILWSVYSISVMFDMLVAFFVLLALYGSAVVYCQKKESGWLLTGLGIGLGILAKGPIVLLFVMPVLLFAFWWGIGLSGRLGRWYIGVFLAFLLGLMIALAWVIPAIVSGGDVYAQEILVKQSKGRMVSSFAHQRPFWWYGPILLGLLFPWTFFPPVWKSLKSLSSYKTDPGLRFCLTWFVLPFILLSLVSGKQVHYLIPMFPAFVLLVGYALSQSIAEGKRSYWFVGLILMFFGLAVVAASSIVSNPYLDKMRLSPWYPDIYLIPIAGAFIALLGLAVMFVRFSSRTRGIIVLSCTSLLFIIISLLGILKAIRPGFDVMPVSQIVSQALAKDIRVAYVGQYHAQYQFFGRLEKFLDLVHRTEIESWAAKNPEGLIVTQVKKIPDESDLIVMIHPYSDRYTVVLKSEAMLDKNFRPALKAMGINI